MGGANQMDIATKKLHSMVDCDNVLNNLSEDWVMYLNKKHGFF